MVAKKNSTDSYFACDISFRRPKKSRNSRKYEEKEEKP